jgi:hypothetical protein
MAITRILPTPRFMHQRPLILERQWVITQTRKGTISENDMEYQLGALGLQELTLKRELA